MHKKSNELEFQGQVITWLNSDIAKRPDLDLEKATQEKPHEYSGKRSDLIVWTTRAAEIAFLSIELKTTPFTSINDPEFFNDAIEKARFLENQVSGSLEYARTGGISDSRPWRAATAVGRN